MRCSSVDAPLHQGLKDPNHRILETHGSGFLSETPAMAGGWSVQIQTVNHPPPQVVLTVLCCYYC